MSSKMLIDAAHPEETRVVVVRGNKLEDFDFESATRKQLRGNIYLAKVTRVEPSLQAAFVDYGGNRHGFLAFNEIHPDYYQIPIADRQALLEEEAEEQIKAQAEEAAHDDAQSSARGSRKRKSRRKSEKAAETGKANGSGDADAVALEAADLTETVSEDNGGAEDDAGDADASANGNGSGVESVGSEDALEELPVRRTRRRRNYKIQEVIKRRQIILVQVVKEERGNKGAALTTYISLAGRYTVLMPNTARGGGISRKITNPTDRKRLRKIAGDLDVPSGMGLIIRTAGASRTKAEIKRDFEYLLRMWENIRDLTLKSTAPTLVYEEGNLIKRSIRDLYGKEIDGVLVAGDEAYKEAKGFMKLLMPSHAKNVQPYKEPEPIFVRHQIERQLSAIFLPHVTLRSGGYIVINQTEALVSIDVNSGKSTREHSIEDTALRTNQEAAEEIARQLRLRDLAGLIVIDFIDMEERRNNRAVERRLKDALKSDRARIQVGRISPFGLLEMSRQRLRAGLLEGSTVCCEVCQGTGIVRSTESVSLDILRTIEDTLLNNGARHLVATSSYEAALYILNYKRPHLKDMEVRYGVNISLAANNQLHGANFSVEEDTSAGAERAVQATAIQVDDTTQFSADPNQEESGQKRSRRRRRRRGRGDHDDAFIEAQTGDQRDGDGPSEASGTDSEEREEGARRPRRRGRRGGRRARGRSRSAPDAAEAAPEGAGDTHEDSDAKSVQAMAATAETAETVAAEPEANVTVEPETSMTAVPEADEKPKRKPRRAASKKSESQSAKEDDEPKKRAPRSKAKAAAKDKDDAKGEKKAKKTASRKKKDEPPASDGNGSAEWTGESGPQPVTTQEGSSAAKAPGEDDRTEGGEAPEGPRRTGWWQRRA
ncbi:MAG: ribonuclease E/G [Hyphomicrobiaceae bacterium]|nr:ribonuclease E/G [Hyphomicrobiaceae bacterium]